MPRFALVFFFLLSPLLARPQIVASNTLLWDLSRVVAGPDADCTSLVPVGVDPHSFEPKPRDLQRLAAADLVVINGLELEPWSDRLVAASGFRGRLVVASQGIQPLTTHDDDEEGHDHGAHDDHGHGGIDPHAWHDPENVRIYVENICAGLSAIDPVNAPSYQTRTRAWLAEFKQIVAEGSALLAQLSPEARKLVTSHDALAYFGRAFQLEVIPVNGLRPDREPNARQMATLVRQIRKHGVKAIFIESTSNPKIPRLLAREAGIAVVTELYTDSLGLPGSSGETFLQLTRSNLRTVSTALRSSAP